MNSQFEQAAQDVKNLTSKPHDDELLKVYAFYKQATVGDNNTPQPGFLDFKGKAKWNAWNNLKGTSKDKAASEYVDFVKFLKTKY